MNTVHIIGKIASEIQVKDFPGPDGPRIKASFLLAVPRPVKDGEPDWVRVESWGKQATNLIRFNGKGSRIAVTGHLRSRFYNPDGSNRGGQLRSAVVANEIVYLTLRKQAPDAVAAAEETTTTTRGGRR